MVNDPPSCPSLISAPFKAKPNLCKLRAILRTDSVIKYDSGAEVSECQILKAYIEGRSKMASWEGFGSGGYEPKAIHGERKQVYHENNIRLKYFACRDESFVGWGWGYISSQSSNSATKAEETTTGFGKGIQA